MIEIKDNFLPIELADTASHYANKLMTRTDAVFSTNYAWDRDSTTSTKERYEQLVLVHNLREGNADLNYQICNAVNAQFPGFKVHNDLVQIYIWTHLARIEWHNDGTAPNSARCGAVTVYLNKSWKIEWGGEFLYKDEEGEVQRIVPDYNRGVFITDVEHRTTPIVGKSIRKALQIWITEDV